MSFITKRERVFNDYDLLDLPARNEGKLKTYASCTDARAWSHFCSDKSEHLVEIIKRNNETIRPKYIPTDVIVNTLMTAKNAEIARLKRKIEEFEQMLTAYDQLDLTCDQKCDIANAHAAIKQANKELDDMCLDLDLSGFTEGIDSEVFETGKSRGDEPSRFIGETGKSGGDKITVRSDEWTFQKEKESSPRKESKSNQAGTSCTCEASTSARDTQLDEMQETIIIKDAKLSAMQNTIAVMEHDICEPYCIYAHIYTALEKIFGTLCQNGKYKQYLDLLTAGKDTRGIDIKGKILFKLKVLEKFSLALIAPCSQNFGCASQDCSCYRAEVLTHVETTFALTSAESQKPSLDNKRAQLIADIMENQEMTEILSKESLCVKIEDDQFDECLEIDDYNVNFENLNRLKHLQANYNELLKYYDNIKHERDCLYLQCQKFADLQNECDCLKNNLREYNELWKEKDFYQKRSKDLDILKQNYFVLSEETSNIETKLKAEQEINKTKSETIDELRNENIRLEQKLGDISLLFEKQKSTLTCKLNDSECKIMCQEQQIKSLSVQIDKLLEQDSGKASSDEYAVQLLEEIESQKEQIQNLKDALCSSEEEKQYLQREFETKLELIKELKLDVEDWKSKYEKTVQSNKDLEKYFGIYQIQFREMQDNNLLMSRELENKTNAIENLENIIYTKSQEIGNLIEKVNHKKDENTDLITQMKIDRDSLASLVNERKIAMKSILSARQDSTEMFKKLTDRDDTNIGQYTKKEFNTNNKVSDDVIKILEETTNKNIENDILLREIELLQETNLLNINILQQENEQSKNSIDLAKKENQILQQNLVCQDTLLQKFEKLKHSHERLLNEKETLQLELKREKQERDKISDDFQSTKKKSENLLNESEFTKEQYTKLNAVHEKVVYERSILQKQMFVKDSEIKNLIQSLNSLKLEHERLLSQIQEIQQSGEILNGLQNEYNKLLSEKKILQKDFDNKNEEINQLYNKLQIKIEENQQLHDQIKDFQLREITANDDASTMRNDYYNLQLNLKAVKQESELLLDKTNHYEKIENEYDELKQTYDKIKAEKDNLQKNLNVQFIDLRKLQQENYDLNNQNQNLLIHSENLEKALIRSRDEHLPKTDDMNEFYTDIKKEIEKLKEEKLINNKKIRELMEKLDESEYFITNLNEDIVARDKRIVILENHVNELEDEIRALQNNLINVVESGEQLKKLSYEKFDQCFNKMKAQQSISMHDMKMELTKLQNEKDNLKCHLSNTKLMSEKSNKEQNQYILRINQLQSEREVIVSNIRQLEIKSIGDSHLSLSNCSIHEIVTALDRISKYLDNKNTCLEQTLLNVQASYQLLKSKADEAKAIAEKEKQKIIHEKEQTKKERMDIEKHLADLKDKIKEDKTSFNKIITDLKGESLNQKLIFDKIIQSKDDHILKLLEGNQLLRDQYDSSVTEINKLTEKLQNACEQKSEKIDLMEKLNIILEDKNKLVLTLQKQLNHCKNKPTQDSGVQTLLFVDKKDEVSQANIYEQKDPIGISLLSNNTILSENDNVENEHEDKFSNFDILKNKNSPRSYKYSDSLGPPINEIQILTANVEPTIDFVKNIYLKYKVKRLSPGKLEQYTIANVKDIKISNVSEHGIDSNVVDEDNQSKNSLSTNLHTQSRRNNDSIIDIYNTQVSTNSTKATDDLYINISNIVCKSPAADLENNNESFENSNINFIKDSKVVNNFNDSLQSTEQDLFLIYKDNDVVYDEQTIPTNLRDVKVSTNNSSKEYLYTNDRIARSKRHRQSNAEENSNSSDIRDDDSAKFKLKINLPRVLSDSNSSMAFGFDRTSFDSYTHAIYAPTKRAVYSETSININNNLENTKLNMSPVPITSNNNFKDRKIITSAYKNQIENDSFHQLSRINANVLVFQNTTNDYFNDHSEDFNLTSNYGLQYVLNTVQNEINPNNIKKMNVVKIVHKNHNDEKFNVSESNSSKQSNSLKMPSIECGTTSVNNGKTRSLNPMKHVSERGTLVKMDGIEDYETKIFELTKALENIETDYNKKIEAVKLQYDSNVKYIINEHNHGVQSIQSLHEETLNDIIKIHENEVENLRTMSIEAMCKAEKLDIENRCLKTKLKNEDTTTLDEKTIKIPSPNLKKRKCKCRINSKTLTTTNVEAFNVKPKRRCHGPCTCSLDMNISETIHNIFEQVDVEQRKMAEQAYVKYIANKILDGTVETLDAQELSFLHLKVCRTWKIRLNKEEALQNKIDSLESELISKQQQTQKHMAELDRKVAKEWRRLQEVREAVCRSSAAKSRDSSPVSPASPVNAAEKDICYCNTAVREGRSAGDLDLSNAITPGCRRKRGKLEINRAGIAKVEGCQGRRERQLVSDETPTRLKRTHDRHNIRTQKK